MWGTRSFPDISDDPLLWFPISQRGNTSLPQLLTVSLLLQSHSLLCSHILFSVSDQSQTLPPYVPQYSLPQGRDTSPSGVTCRRASSHPGLGKLCSLREVARNSGKALLGLLCQLQEGAKTRNRFSHLLPGAGAGQGGQAHPLYGVRVGVCPGVRLEGGLGDLPTPLWCWVLGACPAPCFAPNTQFLLPALHKWQLGFLSFCVFWSRICPNYTCVIIFTLI